MWNRNDAPQPAYQPPTILSPAQGGVNNVFMIPPTPIQQPPPKPSGLRIFITTLIIIFVICMLPWSIPRLIYLYKQIMTAATNFVDNPPPAVMDEQFKTWAWFILGGTVVGLLVGTLIRFLRRI